MYQDPGPFETTADRLGATPFSCCPRCGAGPLHASMVSSVFWHGDRAVMIRGIPATVCTACGEDFISDATAAELDRIRGHGFDGSAADSYVTVPAFDFR
jgi:YgiT-type zinc finger domain-containing protein